MPELYVDSDPVRGGDIPQQKHIWIACDLCNSLNCYPLTIIQTCRPISSFYLLKSKWPVLQKESINVKLSGINLASCFLTSWQGVICWGWGLGGFDPPFCTVWPCGKTLWTVLSCMYLHTRPSHLFWDKSHTASWHLLSSNVPLYI